jgi:hypothetical protein
MAIEDKARGDFVQNHPKARTLRTSDTAVEKPASDAPDAEFTSECGNASFAL